MDQQLIKLEKEKMVAEARAALLDYYARQLASHATILLTVAVIFFTALTTLKGLESTWLCIPLAFMVGSIAMWQVFRFLYYGQMAGHVMAVHLSTIDRSKTDMQALFESAEDRIRTRAVGIRKGAYVLANPATKVRRDGESIDKWRPRAFHLYSFLFFGLGSGSIVYDRLPFLDPASIGLLLWRIWFAANPWIIWTVVTVLFWVGTGQKDEGEAEIDS